MSSYTVRVRLRGAQVREWRPEEGVLEFVEDHRGGEGSVWRGSWLKRWMLLLTFCSMKANITSPCSSKSFTSRCASHTENTADEEMRAKRRRCSTASAADELMQLRLLQLSRENERLFGASDAVERQGGKQCPPGEDP